jgi:hypothetical protein
VWPAILTTAGLFAGASGLTACIIIDDGDDGGGDYGGSSYTVPPPTDVTPMTVAIDPDATITADPGEGVGVYVEYGAGGHWRVSTTCDSNFSGYICTFDAYVSTDPGVAISSVQGENLEDRDAIAVFADGSAHMFAETDSDTDGMTFDAPAGATVRLELYLDNAPQKQFVYWFGNGVLHTGAPTDPVDFAPSSE